MKKYEEFRGNGWKCYNDDPCFNGEAPAAKVISYFTKGNVYKPAQEKNVEKPLDYDMICNVEWVQQRLKKTLQYKRTWYGDNDIYKFAALQNYVDQCISGGYNKCILSWQEVYMIKEKK